MMGCARQINLEVAQHIGDGVVRCVALDALDGVKRGLEVIDTGAPIYCSCGKRKFRPCI